jgi:ribosome-binding protein aMBF1 (putative translation factor)
VKRWIQQRVDRLQSQDEQAQDLLMPNATRKVASANTGADLAYVNADVLTWAIKRSHLSRQQVASKLKIDEERIAAWENETPIPFEKAQALATLLRFPFGYFFLKKPPTDELPMPSGGTCWK